MTALPPKLLLLAGLVLLALTGTARSTPAARAKPDLVVSSATLKGLRYAFTDGGGKVAFAGATRNVGNSPSGPTEIELIFIAPGQGWAVTQRRVPALRPGGLSKGRKSTTNLSYLPLGGYRVRVCVDATERVAESNEANNCRSVGRFYVAKRVWAGEINGTLRYTTSGSASEAWTSDSARFRFAGYKNGKFDYLFSGAVSYTETGSDGTGCAVSGGGTARSGGSNGASASMTLDYLHARYSASGLVGNPKPPLYAIRRSCQPGVTTPGPAQRFWLNVAHPGTRPLPFRMGVIKGTSTGPDFTGYPSQWEWDLR